LNVTRKLERIQTEPTQKNCAGFVFLKHAGKFSCSIAAAFARNE